MKMKLSIDIPIKETTITISLSEKQAHFIADAALRAAANNEKFICEITLTGAVPKDEILHP